MNHSPRLNDLKYLKGFWKLNSNSADYSGHGNDGTFTGTELYTENKFGLTSANLNGSSTITHTSIATDTVCYWLGDDFYVYDGTNYYTNGEISGSFTVQSTDTTIGGGVTDKMYEVRHYNIILTADEILQLFKQTYPKLVSVEQPINQIPDVADSSLKGAWLNKNTIGTAKDLSSNNNDGTVVGNITYEKTGVTFDGVNSANNSQITIANDPSLKPTTNLTILGWVKIGSTKRQVWLHSWYGYTLEYNLNYINFALRTSITGSGAGVSSNPTTYTATGELLYIVATYDSVAEKSKLYINGELIRTGDASGIIDYTSNPIVLGDRSDGGVDSTSDSTQTDFRIYSDTKTADWIKTEYQKGVPDSDLIIHIDSNEDLTKNKISLTYSNAILGNGIDFSNGGITWTSQTFTSYSYWYKTSGKWTNYFYDGTDDYTNGVLTGSKPVSISATGFSGVTAKMRNIKCYNRTPSVEEIKINYEKEKKYF